MRRGTALLSCLLLLSALSPVSAAQPKVAGTSCSKLGAKKAVQAITFTCKRVGTKTVWVKRPTKPNLALPTIAVPSGTPSTPGSDTTRPREGQPCPRKSADVVGFDRSGRLVNLMCNEWDDRYIERPKSIGGFDVDQITGRRLFDRNIADQSAMASDWRYFDPPMITTEPRTERTPDHYFSSVDPCRLRDGDPDLMNMSVGFPIPQGRTSTRKTIRIQILAVDFPDRPAQGTPLSEYGKVAAQTKAFWESQSAMGMRLDFIWPESYVRLNQSLVSFGLSADLSTYDSGASRRFSQHVVEALDPSIDFTRVDSVLILVPVETTASEVGTWVVDTQQVLSTAEGKIYNRMSVGAGASKTAPAMWIHEFGHTLGLTDMRFVDSQNSSKQRPDGLGMYDIMGVGSAAPETLIWSRFLTGMIGDDQIHCVTSTDPTTHWLRPLPSKSSELKGVVIPISDTLALVVESRRAYGYDGYMGLKNEGALVYAIDTTVPYKQTPARVVWREGSVDRIWETDSTLKTGQFVERFGWKVTVVESGDFGDVIRVERSN